MRQFFSPKSFLLLCIVSLILALAGISFAQSKPQVSTETPKGTQKKNPRPSGTPDDQKKEDEKAIEDTEVLKIAANIVNVDAVVYNKKNGTIVTGLKKENFAIFENGVKQEISNFATPESPITVSVVVEFSKWTEEMGFYASRGQENGMNEVIRPVAYFVSNFIKPPDDYASIIAFDMRPTPITDFTNDPQRLRQSVDLLLRNYPAFRENNLWDALNFAIMGGRGDTVVLEKSKEKYADYSGMIAVKSRRKAILLVASGLDSFSRINYDKLRKIVQNAGVPVYIIGTGNLFFKLYEERLPTLDPIGGGFGRMSFIQATNALNTIAKESGGMHIPITFEGEVPNAIRTVNALLRSQYSLAYEIGERAKDGKKYNIVVKVDINGDGQFDEDYIVQHRPFYVAAKG